MKTALVTTTVNVPHVLKLYRACDPGVKMFVALDAKSDLEALSQWGDADSQISWLTPEYQKSLGYKCSELIGWNSIQRRDIAFLEALKWGAEIIVSIDDDNLPLCTPYCGRHVENLLQPHDGVMADYATGWFDAGTLLRPQAKHRGFPHKANSSDRFSSVAGSKVGVSAGICLGDPDIDATTRIANSPEVHQVSQLLEAGIVVNPNIWTVFNSQNTAVLREFIPAWGMLPFVGRMDDIYASLICQRVMRERDYHVHFGKPFVWQQRNEHNLVKDLRGEIDGYENVERLADVLDHIPLLGKSVIDDCRTIWSTLNHADFIPGRTVSAMMAYIDDCEEALR